MRDANMIVTPAAKTLVESYIKLIAATKYAIDSNRGCSGISDNILNIARDLNSDKYKEISKHPAFDYTMSNFVDWAITNVNAANKLFASMLDLAKSIGCSDNDINEAIGEDNLRLMQLMNLSF